MNIGVGELVMLGVIILIIFSASRMGSLGNAIGKFVYSFKKASKGTWVLITLFLVPTARTHCR